MSTLSPLDNSQAIMNKDIQSLKDVFNTKPRPEFTPLCRLIIKQDSSSATL